MYDWSIYKASGADFNRRSGLIAIKELMLVVVALLSVFWLGPQLWVNVDNDPSNLALHGCSERSVYRTSMDRDGRRMWVYRQQEGVSRLDLETGKAVQTLPTSGLDLCAVAHRSDGASSLLCGQDGTVIWCFGEDPVVVDVCTVRKEMIIDAAISADSTIAVSITSRGAVRGWHRNGEEICELSYNLPCDGIVNRVALSHSGQRLCVACSGQPLMFFDPKTGERETDEIVLNFECHALTWTDDDRAIAVAGIGGAVRLFDTQTRTCIWEQTIPWRSHAAIPTALSISADHHFLAIASNSCHDIVVCSLDGDDTFRRFQGHHGIVRTLNFSPTTERLYSGSYDGSIREWSVDSGKEKECRIIN